LPFFYIKTAFFVCKKCPFYWLFYTYFHFSRI